MGQEARNRKMEKEFTESIGTSQTDLHEKNRGESLDCKANHKLSSGIVSHFQKRKICTDQDES